MIKPDFVLKVGDTLPKLEATLRNSKTKLPIGDLTGASVLFRYKIHGTTTWLSIVGSIANAVKSMVEVAWSPGDSDIPGEYDMEFVITFSGGGVMTVPNEGCLLLSISQC